MPTPQPPSLITAAPPRVDAPVVQDTNYRFDKFDRAYLDSQILGLQRLVTALLTGALGGTIIKLASTSAAAPVGSCVCSAGLTPPQATLAVAAALPASLPPMGVVIQAAAPGGYVQVATSGIVPASITGLAPGTAGVAIVNKSTGALQVIALSSLVSTQSVVGYVDVAGNLTIAQSINISESGGGSGPDESPILLSFGIGGASSSPNDIATGSVAGPSWTLVVSTAFDNAAVLNLGNSSDATAIAAAVDLTVRGTFGPFPSAAVWPGTLPILAAVTGSPTVGAAQVLVSQGPVNS